MLHIRKTFYNMEPSNCDIRIACPNLNAICTTFSTLSTAEKIAQVDCGVPEMDLVLISSEQLLRC